MLLNSFLVFFGLHGPIEASFYEITFGRRPLRRERETRHDMMLDLFAEFELHPSDIFRENRCWNDEYSFLNMISTKLSDQRNSKNAVLRIPCGAGRFKFTIQCSNFPWQPTAVQNQANCVVELCKVETWLNFSVCIDVSNKWLLLRISRVEQKWCKYKTKEE